MMMMCCCCFRRICGEMRRKRDFFCLFICLFTADQSCHSSLIRPPRLLVGGWLQLDWSECLWCTEPLQHWRGFAVSLFLHWAAAPSTVLLLLHLIIIIAATQRLIHPDGAKAVSADRWELIFSFSVAMESIVSSLFLPLASTLSSLFFPFALIRSFPKWPLVFALCFIIHTHIHTLGWSWLSVVSGQLGPSPPVSRVAWETQVAKFLSSSSSRHRLLEQDFFNWITRSSDLL